MRDKDQTLLINLSDHIDDLMGLVKDKEIEEIAASRNLSRKIEDQLREIGHMALSISDDGKDDFEEIDFDFLFNLTKSSFRNDNLLDNQGLWHQVFGELPRIKREIEVTLESAPV